MKLLDLIFEANGKPKAIITGGGAGSGKSHFVNQILGTSSTKDAAEKLESNGWKFFNPDLFARDPEHPMYKNLAAASSQNRKDVEATMEMEDKPNIVWDTTANNVEVTLQVPRAGYETKLFMLFTHPMVSLFNNFHRGGIEGEEALPLYTVLKTWVPSYKAETINAYSQALGDNFYLVNNPGNPAHKKAYDRLIGEFNAALEISEDAVVAYFDRLEDDPFFKTTMSKGAPTLPPELQKDYDEKVKALGEKLTPDEDKSFKREILKYYKEPGVFRPLTKGKIGGVGKAVNGYKEMLQSVRNTKERVRGQNVEAAKTLYSILKNQSDNMVSVEEAVQIAKKFI